MPTIDDIKQAVVEELIFYLSHQPLIKRLDRVPPVGELDIGVKLRDLGFDHRDNFAFGAQLARRGLCQRLATWQTAQWATIEDVVTTVIRYR